VGYFSRVYTSPTLVATPFQRILRSGAWRGDPMEPWNYCFHEASWTAKTSCSDFGNCLDSWT